MNTIEDNAYNYATTKCRCSRCSGYDHMGMRVCNKSEDKTFERFRSLREGYIDGAKRAVTIKNHNYSKI